MDSKPPWRNAMYRRLVHCGQESGTRKNTTQSIPYSSVLTRTPAPPDAASYQGKSRPVGRWLATSRTNSYAMCAFGKGVSRRRGSGNFISMMRFQGRALRGRSWLFWPYIGGQRGCIRNNRIAKTYMQMLGRSMVPGRRNPNCAGCPRKEEGGRVCVDF